MSTINHSQSVIYSPLIATFPFCNLNIKSASSISSLLHANHLLPLTSPYAQHFPLFPVHHNHHLTAPNIAPPPPNHAKNSLQLKCQTTKPQNHGRKPPLALNLPLHSPRSKSAHITTETPKPRPWLTARCNSQNLTPRSKLPANRNETSYPDKNRQRLPIIAPVLENRPDQPPVRHKLLNLVANGSKPSRTSPLVPSTLHPHHSAFRSPPSPATAVPHRFPANPRESKPHARPQPAWT